MLGWLVACLGTWLIGVNCAILYRFWPEKWLTVKMIATSGLLAYCILSVLYGQPAQWRVAVGLAAICLDAGAIAGIWDALRLARAGDGVLIAYRRR
jgi:hypothetical protein